MVEIAIIISAITFLSLLYDRSRGITGRVIQEAAITDEAEMISITSVIGGDGREGKLDTLIIRAETEGTIDLEDSLVIINVGNVSARLRYRNGTLVRDTESGFYTR